MMFPAGELDTEDEPHEDYEQAVEDGEVPDYLNEGRDEDS